MTQQPEHSFLDALSGPEKSAYLLLSLPKDEAAAIVSHLEENELDKVVTAMAKIDQIDASQKAEVLSYFQQTARTIQLGNATGLAGAKSLLEASMGKEAAKRILNKLDETDTSQDFAYLNQVPDATLANLLLVEHPQTIAIALANLQPQKSANILKQLPQDKQKEVALRLARTNQIHPDAVANLANSLRRRLAHMQEQDYSSAGGIDSLANILNHVDRHIEDGLLDKLGSEDANLVEQLREKLFVFEELANLELAELRMVISELPDDRRFAKALRGTGEEVRRAFFASMSQNRANDIAEEIRLMGPTPLREINDARRQIMEIARRLDEVHDIVLKKDREEFI
jgi:flagellar motor switch protein FliG